MEHPETRYARTEDGVHIAYQVLGEGPQDLVYISPWFSHVEYIWELPQRAAYLRRIASFSRLIVFDRRGMGMSDPVAVERLPDAETRMDDITAVLDAVGSKRAVVYGASESGALAMLFAATHPDRTFALVIHGSYPSARKESGAPWGWTAEAYEEEAAAIEEAWGTVSFFERQWPHLRHERDVLSNYAAYSRRAMSPGAALAAWSMEFNTDVRDVLPAIHVPTLILHRREDEPEAHRFMASRIPGAELVELPGDEHVPYFGDMDSVLDEIERFMKAVRGEEVALDRVLATVLFTDIVGSTERAVELGDRAWSDLLERHHATVRGLLARYRGTEVDTAGDGFFATFDGPARAVRCAQAIAAAMPIHELAVRAGVHTGEIATIDGKAGGMGVVIGARIGALAGPSEVLASSTVKDLTIGSGLRFEDAGEHELKGVPDRWRLYRALAPSSN